MAAILSALQRRPVASSEVSPSGAQKPTPQCLPIALVRYEVDRYGDFVGLRGETRNPSTAEIRGTSPHVPSRIVGSAIAHTEIVDSQGGRYKHKKAPRGVFLLGCAKDQRTKYQRKYQRPKFDKFLWNDNNIFLCLLKKKLEEHQSPLSTTFWIVPQSMSQVRSPEKDSILIYSMML